MKILEVIQFLLEHGADPNVGIHWSYSTADCNTNMKLLLQHGADPNGKIIEGNTPLIE